MLPGLGHIYTYILKNFKIKKKIFSLLISEIEIKKMCFTVDHKDEMLVKSLVDNIFINYWYWNLFLLNELVKLCVGQLYTRPCRQLGCFTTSLLHLHLWLLVRFRRQDSVWKDRYYRFDLPILFCLVCINQILLITYYSSFTLEQSFTNYLIWHTGRIFLQCGTNKYYICAI